MMNVVWGKYLVKVHLNVACARRGPILLIRVEPRVSSVLWVNSLLAQVLLVVMTAKTVVSRQLGLRSVYPAAPPDNCSPLVRLALKMKIIYLHLASGGIMQMTTWS